MSEQNLENKESSYRCEGKAVMQALANSVKDPTEPYREQLLHEEVQSSHRKEEGCGSGTGTQHQAGAGGVINSRTETQQNWVSRGAEETTSSKIGSLEPHVESDPRPNPLGSCITAVQDPALQGEG